MSAAFDLEILVRTVYGEARSEPFEGKLAVAYSILTRWKSKKWYAGKTAASTAMMDRQYSAWNSGKEFDKNRRAMCDATEAELVECANAVTAAITGTEPDPTDGATHYCHISLAPNWATGTPTVTIGSHAFYKDIP